MEYYIRRSFVIAIHAVILFLTFPLVAGNYSCQALAPNFLTLGLEMPVEGAVPPLEVLIDKTRALTLDDILGRPELASAESQEDVEREEQLDDELESPDLAGDPRIQVAQEHDERQSEHRQQSVAHDGQQDGI